MIQYIDKNPGIKKEYIAWAGMKRRCLNKKCNVYEYYGGRGITFDPRWKKFKEFLRDMGKCPDNKLTLERKDSNKNYSKENCCWADRNAQARSKRNTRWVLLNDEKITVYELADRFNVKRATMNTWIDRKGLQYAAEKAVSSSNS